MSDHRQGVTWALEQRCALRPETSVNLAQAHQQTWLARAYARELAKPPENSCLIGNSLVYDTRVRVPQEVSKERYARFPTSVRLLDDAFAPLGGAQALRALCESCPANINTPYPAGCTGYFTPPSQLNALAERLGIREELDRLLLPTTQLRYGLWVLSPIPAAALPLIRQLLREATPTDPQEHAAFLGALERAERSGLRLHVALNPPGHSDFGVTTTFPHCPRCKVFTGLRGRWSEEPMPEAHDCPVCFLRYNPNLTHTREDWESLESGHDLPAPDLEPLALAFLKQQGFTEDEARQIIHSQTPPEKAQKHLRDFYAQGSAVSASARRRQEKQRFLSERLFAGLDSNTEAGYPTFSYARFCLVLERCAAQGIEVARMGYFGEAPPTFNEYFAYESTLSPQEQLALWHQAGQSTGFWALFYVPSGALDSLGEERLA